MNSIDEKEDERSIDANASSSFENYPSRLRSYKPRKFIPKNIYGHVGLAHGAKSAPPRYSLEEAEARVRTQIRRKWRVMNFLRASVADCLVFIVYLITIETFISCGLTVGLTYHWHSVHMETATADWNGSNISFVLLGFAIITPITVSIGLAFRRREQALYEIRRIRSYCFQIYICHGIWDWVGSELEPSGRVEAGINWLEHTDLVLEQLIGIGDELSRFLTLPTSSRSHHRMLSSGMREATAIFKVAYRLFDSLYTQRIIQISLLNEKFKTLGLSGSEVSRIRQYERYIGEAIEGLRMIKMYRTPQALRAFGRIFTLIVPPFYAPKFAQLALDLNSLYFGICFAALTPFCLTALFESTQALEDPFVGFVSLDGIDVKEEFEVLHWHQLVNARKKLFPHAEDYDEKGRAAIDKWQPMENHHSPQGTGDVGDSIRSSHFNPSFKGKSDYFADLAFSSHSRQSTY